MPSEFLYASFPNVRVVRSFEELVSTRFAGEVNALCWPRVLHGDFDEVARVLDVGQGITHLDAEQLRGLTLSEGGQQAVETMLADVQRLVDHGLDPTLDCINGYLPVENPGPLRTDVCSFHADSATCEADTYLCTYAGASSEGVMNQDVIRHVDVPETRAMLLARFGGADDETFEEWLGDHYFDLHYAPRPDARVFSFGQGHLWRVATLHAGCAVPPCVHRAPDPVPGQKRLLLIS